MKYIKLFEEQSAYNIYDIIAMQKETAEEVLLQEIKKIDPDVELIKNIIEFAPIDVNMSLGLGHPDNLLQYSIVKKNNDLFDLLLAHPRIDLNHKDSRGVQLIIYATEFAPVDIIEILATDKRVDVNAIDHRRLSALKVCVMSDNVYGLLALMKNPKLNLDYIEDYADKWNMLMYGVISNSLDCIKILLENSNIDINYQDERGTTALMLACENHSTRIIKLLLSYPQIDVKIRNTKNKTAWDLASQRIKDEFPQLNPRY